MQTILPFLLLAGLSLLVVPDAHAKRPVPAFALSLGPAVGVGGMGLGVQPRLEAGVVLPELPDLTLSGTVAWAHWSPEGEAADPRLDAGSYTWSLRQDDFAFGVSGDWAFGAQDQKLRPDAGLALGLTVVRSYVNGDAGGEALGTTVELSSRPGLGAYGGVRYALGPGALLGRLELDLTPLVGQVTGDKLLFTVAPMVGYRIQL